MTSVGPEAFFAEITGSAATVAAILADGDLARQVPTCPDWTLRQLGTHFGRAHRWAAEIVSIRSSEFIPFRQVPDGRFPDDPAAAPEWIRAGAARVVEAIASADDAPVWAFDGLRPAGFWARRMAHESAVHRADAQLTVGERPVIDPVIAADGIAEWLGFVSAPEPGQDDPRAPVLAGGRSLHVHATDQALAGDGEWVIRESGGLALAERGHAKADTAVRGPASALLLMLVRRLPVDDPDVEVIGDAALLDAWLAATPF